MGTVERAPVYVQATGSCAGEREEQVEELAEEDSRERGWVRVCVHQRKSEGRHRAAWGTRMAAPSQHCARGGHGGQREAGFWAASACALA